MDPTSKLRRTFQVPRPSTSAAPSVLPPRKKQRTSLLRDDNGRNSIASGSLDGPLVDSFGSLPRTSSAPGRQGVGKGKDEEGPYYMVMWRKPQMKKHKTWDGDAVLIVRGTTCSLKDTATGRDLVSRAPFTARTLKPGDELTVGGKECEVDRELPEEEYLQGRPFIKAASDLSQAVTPATSFYAKVASKKPVPVMKDAARAIGLHNSGTWKEAQPRHDPNRVGAIVMKRPSSEHQARFNKRGLPVVDVVVDPHLATALRPHQVEGVKFMYECVMGMRGHDGQGCILADEMGLGKTLQTIALIWTLLKQSCYFTPGQGAIDRALIACPVSLINNWKREVHKWLGRNALNVLCIEGNSDKTDVRRFMFGKTYQVMIIGYEKLRSVVDLIKDARPPVGLVVCDEGHRLKSGQAKTTQMIKALKTPSRIILSGTPIQNDLSEFYTMVDFVNPGLLDSYTVFKKMFEDPIIKSRTPNCMPSALKLGQARVELLNKVTKQFVLRRTAELLNAFLPPKHEQVIFVSPTPLQVAIYRKILGSGSVKEVFKGEMSQHLVLIGILRKLCNTPELLLPMALEKADGKRGVGKDVLDRNLLQGVLECFDEKQRRSKGTIGLSGKLLAMSRILECIKSTTDEKVVIVSNFTQTLDVLESFLGAKRWSCLRLDGKTPQDERQYSVSKFNKCNQDECFVFLLSAKSGGQGLNIIGASRLILFDSDWNPSTDRQAMARIHRDGQRKPCYIYRLLITGTMDEKIYQRQVTKVGLSDSLMDNAGASSSKSSDSFTLAELRNLYQIHSDTPCLTHDLLACGCAKAGDVGGKDKGKGRDDDESVASEDEDLSFTFMPASQVNENSAQKDLKDKRAKLAALSEWAHYDCTSRAGVSALEDEVLKRVIEQTGRDAPPKELRSASEGCKLAGMGPLDDSSADPSSPPSVPESSSPMPEIEEGSFDVEKTVPGSVLFVFSKSSVGPDKEEKEAARA